MEVIIADANVFVYLYLSSFLEKILSVASLQIKITNEVYDELTNKRRRISKEYPNLKIIIDNSIHDRVLLKGKAITMMEGHWFVP